MEERLTIKLTEKGKPVAIPKAAWAKNGSAQDLNRLKNCNIIKTEHTDAYVLIYPSVFVGAYEGIGAELTIKPKLDGIDDILRHLAQNQPYVEEATHRTGLDKFFEDDLWHKFVSCLTDLHREGIPWRYKKEKINTSAPRGRINFRDTIRNFSSRGINHSVVSEVTVRLFDDDLGAICEAAYRYLCRNFKRDQKSIQTARRLIDTFSGRKTIISRWEAIEACQKLAVRYSDRKTVSETVEFVRSLLGDISPETTSLTLDGGIAEFTDMQTLWEVAVLSMAEKLPRRCSASWKLHPLRGKGVTLFKDGGPEIDPDLMGEYLEGKVVVDAKYSIKNSASADDVYQISSYIRRTKSNTGILVYLSGNNSTTLKKIGTTDTGARVWFLGVGVDEIKSQKFPFKTLAQII